MPPGPVGSEALRVPRAEPSGQHIDWFGVRRRRKESLRGPPTTHSARERSPEAVSQHRDMLLLLSLLPFAFGYDLETANGIQSMLPPGDLIDLIARDAENIPPASSFGHKFMTGGAGEGEQKLKEEENFQQRQQVKSDNVLPAYCEPPNPCPVGFTAEDGCLEDFDNTAEFSRNYQAQQQCICDQEHMFNCAAKEASDIGESLQELLAEQGFHEKTIAKKFHEKRSNDDAIPRRKRSIPEPKKVNPYLQGEPLRTMQKKNGQHIW